MARKAASSGNQALPPALARLFERNKEVLAPVPTPTPRCTSRTPGTGLPEVSLGLGTLWSGW